MQNFNRVCLDCHTSGRSNQKCPKCHKDMVCIGSRWRVPKQGDLKAWKELCEKFSYLKEKPDDISIVIEEH
jgi:C4-type Zn-finger protein